MLHAKRAQMCLFGGGTSGGIDLEPRALAELHSGKPDTAGGGVDHTRSPGRILATVFRQ